MSLLAGKRVKTPTVLQMEYVECGAASLCIILGYWGRHVPLETLRVDCGVSRDGSKASTILKAARKHGLVARGMKAETDALKQLPLPMIVHWNFNHFLVVEGFDKKGVWLNDPAQGPRRVDHQEFDGAYTGVALAFEPDEGFEPRGKEWSPVAALVRRVRGSELALAFLVVVGLALIVPNLIVPTFTRIFVDDLLVGSMRDWLLPLLGAMAATMLVQAGLTALQRAYLLRLQTKISLTSSSKFLWHVLRLPVRFFLQRNPGELANRIAINDQVAEILSGQLAGTLLALLMVVFYAVLMLQYDPVLTLVGVATAGANLLALRWFARLRTDANRKLAQERGKLTGVSMSGLQIIETLKASAGESDFFARWAGHHARVVNAGQEAQAASQFLSAIPAFLTSASTIAILGFGGLRVMDAELSIGMLIAFQALMAGLLGPVNQLLGLGTMIQSAAGDMRRLDDVLAHELDAEVADQEDPAATAPARKLTGHLELKDVTFGYAPLDPPFVDGLDLTLRPGTRVALVGGSGSGKSTAARLVSGLYEPWQGDLHFDGKSRNAFRRETVRSSVAVVDQEVFLFAGTILENLTLWDATIPEARVVRAARDACIHDDIVARHGGYEARVEEGGRNWSGGQRQRLEIARALVNNPSILVLDEATSALDPLTEKQIDENLRRRGCTCLIIAHRLSTIRDADEIVVMDQGKVVERGTHDTLLAAGGAYARLVGAE